MTGNTNNTVSMGFNPVSNEIRVVTASNLNFRVNATTGALVAQDTSLAYAAGDPNVGSSPSMVALAHNNHATGASSTTLFGWDYNNDALVTVGGPNGSPSPNGGNLFTVNTPGQFLTSGGAVGMSISSQTGICYVTHDDPSNAAIMSLYTRDLATGTETLVGQYPAGVFVADISVAPVPEPALTLAAAGLVGLAVASRRRK
jgi:hypothetical protein